MSNTRIAELLAANAKFAETWSSPPSMVQLREAMQERVICLTCMDPRVVPEQFLGANPGIAVFRNAGGRASPDIVRTINTLQSLGKKSTSPVTVMVVHHTDCGMTHLTDEDIKSDLRNRGIEGADGIDYGCYAAEDIKKSVLDDIETLKASPLLAGVNFKGFVLSTETGLLEEL